MSITLSLTITRKVFIHLDLQDLYVNLLKMSKNCNISKEMHQCVGRRIESGNDGVPLVGAPGMFSIVVMRLYISTFSKD